MRITRINPAHTHVRTLPRDVTRKVTMEVGTRKPRMSKAQARQHQRILTDEKVQEQQQIIRNEVRATLRASWNESLEEASERKILVKKTEEIEREVALANKALIMVRRAQLKELLEEEWREYEAELHKLGLALHRDRT